MRKFTRRQCVKGSAVMVGAAMFSALPAHVRARARGANGDIRVAVVGLRTRGSQLVDIFLRLPDVRIVALCDCDTQFFDRELKKFADAKTKPRTVVDFRRLLDAKDVDAVVIASPDHWHALMTVWACQAGKDVYVEKPISNNIWEGRQMVAAAGKYNRIVQTGTQNRSDIGLAAARKFVQAGKLGKIRLARAFSFPRRKPIGKVDGPQKPPATCDYNLYRGPAPLTPLRRKVFHYDWHWFWDTATGECGNRGVHIFDHIRWIIGQDELSTGAVTIGGRMAWDDDGETPNAQVTLLEGKGAPILFALSDLPRGKGAARKLGHPKARGTTLIEYEGGYLTGGRGGATAFDWKHKEIKTFKGDAGRTHAANFIAAMRSRKPADLRADVLQGHISSAMCHMANVSYLVGYQRREQEIRKAAGDNEVLADAYARLAGHLKGNNVNLDTDRLTLGASVTMDPKTERFTGASAEWANMYLDRVYRPPFVVPQKV